jgi:hypothetical protein
VPTLTIGPDVRCTDSDGLRAALQAVADVASRAEALERDGVTRQDVRRLADAGALGDQFTAAQARELQEQLAAASGALWFVVAQHRSPTDAARATANEPLRERWASGLASGALLGAVAFAHLRRPTRTVSAERCPGGWQVSGRLDWITSWGLAEVVLLMTETSERQVVQALIPARERDGLVITGELSLAAMGGTSTVGAVLDGMYVTDAEVVDIVPKARWAAHDAQRTANVPSAVVGLARAAVDGILAVAEQRDWGQLGELGHRWREQLLHERAAAYVLIDEVDPATAIDERLALRASITRLAQGATSVLVLAEAGRSMLTSSAAQRWSREATFALVQAQTFASRNAVIEAYGTVAAGRAGR